MGILVIAAIIGFFWVCSKISQANREQQEREARARREAEQRRLREIQERAAAEERRKHEAYLQRRRTDPYFDMMERQKEEREKEAKRQAELTRRRNLAAQFKYITLGGYKAAYCFDYYPKNRFPSVTAQQEADRRAVWNFKDGSYTYGLNRLADFLDANFTKVPTRRC